MALAPGYGANSAFCARTRSSAKLHGDRPESGIYKIQMPGLEAKDVECIFGSGSPKTVIQKRTTGKLNFNRGWRDYKYGFSNDVEVSPFNGGGSSMRGPRPKQCNLQEYWIGLEYIHALTQDGYNNLRIDLERYDGQEGTVTYGNFDIGSEREQYRLNSLGEFSNDGNRDLGDAFRGTGFGDQGYSRWDKEDTNHEGMPFSTYDRDNDKYDEGNCAREDGSGWWFNRCSAANLNGKHYGKGSTALYRPKNDQSFDDGILWMTWTQNKFESLTGSKMSLGGVDFDETDKSIVNYKDCQEIAEMLYKKGQLTQGNAEDFNGVYNIYTNSEETESKPTQCKFYAKGRTPCGLTLIQKRMDGAEDFNRGWSDYKRGFGLNIVSNRGPRPNNDEDQSLGDGVSEGWLGNDPIWHLTNNIKDDYNRAVRMGLLVEMDRKYDAATKFDNSAACRYDFFRTGDERSLYTLFNIDGYSSVYGNPGDAFAGADFGSEGFGNDIEITRHKGMKFSTRDRDNDNDAYYHCGRQDKSGWWFNGCSAANLNGHYYSAGVVEGGRRGQQLTSTDQFDDGILWETWTATKWESLMATRMWVGHSEIMNIIFGSMASTNSKPTPPPFREEPTRAPDCDRTDSHSSPYRNPLCADDVDIYSDYEYKDDDSFYA
ncbi:Oidioi.mRNA.OKI2018_I69.XSR.g17026.t1.cds [Oikopleura dioica]|uniref:Oidioi.mRNA.OKI2018_I69.XSR.g17026.t1.cds n=1 Tax=Oikopleura dioica TaxID=34765 RepID=A0ABN7SML5_OIKDI|nr:Oidioi.mRNA.OKI2018_I69.XSR.g17026.t1.cds [Oikopleura dioica]